MSKFSNNQKLPKNEKDKLDRRKDLPPHSNDSDDYRRSIDVDRRDRNYYDGYTMNKRQKIATIDWCLARVEDTKLILNQQQEATAHLESVLQEARAELVAKPERPPRVVHISDGVKTTLLANLTRSRNKKSHTGGNGEA